MIISIMTIWFFCGIVNLILYIRFVNAENWSFTEMMFQFFGGNFSLGDWFGLMFVKKNINDKYTKSEYKTLSDFYIHFSTTHKAYTKLVDFFSY